MAPVVCLFCLLENPFAPQSVYQTKQLLLWLTIAISSFANHRSGAGTENTRRVAKTPDRFEATTEPNSQRKRARDPKPQRHKLLSEILRTTKQVDAYSHRFTPT